jgi:penicillin-binding protein-related factor A (putative recombinase)
VARAWRVNSGVFKQTYNGKDRYIRANTAVGMSDIMGILKDGRTLAIEVKSATGTVKAHQHEFLNSIATAGGIAFVARSVEEVLTKLEGV